MRFGTFTEKLAKKHVRRKIIVDHKGNLLHVNPPRPHICSDQHTTSKGGRGRAARLAQELSRTERSKMELTKFHCETRP